MSVTLESVLAQLAAGEITAEEAAPQVRDIVRAASKRRAGMGPNSEGYADRLFQAVVDGESMYADDGDTFRKIEVALLRGALSREQHDVLRAAVLGPA